MTAIHPSSTTNGIGHTSNGSHASINGSKPIILHLGGPILYSYERYSRFESNFTVERPELSELDRPRFIQHLKERTWGNFSAIIRPFWNNGGEMGRWDRELIELLPESMKVMASAGAGFDWVDTETLGEHGILYANGAGASTESVAEVALWYIIGLFRQMKWTSSAADSNVITDFQKAHRDVMFSSHNPKGHTLGLVGFGHIGFAIAKKVHRALEMRILYYDIARKPAAMEDEVAAARVDSLDKLLKASDCVLLASPGGPPILDARTLALMKKGSFVVNIARGSLIDEDALADALDSGHIGAAGLDVHAHEPKVNPRLTGRLNVTVSCHTGGGSVDTVRGFETLVMDNVEAVLTGQEPLTAVNRQHLRRRNTNGELNGYVYDEERNEGRH